MYRYAVKMGRRRVHDDATAVALLDAAEKIVEADGLAALTVRAVADAVGSTTRAVYSTLGSKPALVGALGARAFDMLGELVSSVPITEDPAVDLVTAGLRGFRRFAVEHPALFHVGVQQTDVPPEARETIYRAAARALSTLHLRVERLRAAGGLGERPLADATWEFHSLCEGLAALELRGIIGPENAERIWTDALSSLISGWHR
jgi:AcrR family transcriptional regulator